MEITYYGITETNSATDALDIAVEEILHNGYTIINDALTSQQITDYKNSLDTIYALQCSEVGGEDNLALIKDANVARCLLAYDPIFLKLAKNEQVMEICNKVLGDNFMLLMQNGILNRPQNVHYQTSWHRDLNYQHWVSTKPLALSALFCLDDFNQKTGGTKVLAGSHAHAKFPSDIYIKNHTIDVEAPAGSVLIMDAMLFHCSGFNTLTNVRRGVNHVIGLPILSQQISIPEMLQGQYSDDPFLNKYLGYRWSPKKDVKQWRLARIQAAQLNE